MNGIRRRQTYDKEFKLEAVRLVLEEGHSVASVERKLGTGKGVIYNWVHQFTDDSEHAFPGKGNLKPPDKELYELKKELERVKRERDILKKAVAIFSKDPDRYTRS
ncbi:MAG: transposase [Desulfobacterales bacterium]|jgi:transposase